MMPDVSALVVNHLHDIHPWNACKFSYSECTNAPGNKGIAQSTAIRELLGRHAQLMNLLCMSCMRTVFWFMTNHGTSRVWEGSVAIYLETRLRLERYWCIRKGPSPLSVTSALGLAHGGYPYDIPSLIQPSQRLRHKVVYFCCNTRCIRRLGMQHRPLRPWILLTAWPTP